MAKFKVKETFPASGFTRLAGEEVPITEDGVTHLDRISRYDAEQAQAKGQGEIIESRKHSSESSSGASAANSDAPAAARKK